MDWVSFGERGKQLARKYKYPLCILLLGLLLLTLPSGNEKEEVPAVPTDAPKQGMTIAQELTEILSRMDGVGKVQVMLTLATGEKTVYQTDDEDSSSESTSGIRRKTVIITDTQRNQSGLIQQIDPPTYLGAIVVCQGADRPSVRLALVEAVSKITGLGANQISILKMK